jgi:hypothetical protein
MAWKIGVKAWVVISLALNAIFYYSNFDPLSDSTNNSRGLHLHLDAGYYTK